MGHRARVRPDGELEVLAVRVHEAAMRDVLLGLALVLGVATLAWWVTKVMFSRPKTPAPKPKPPPPPLPKPRSWPEDLPVVKK
jgi:hypothetical protein